MDPIERDSLFADLGHADEEIRRLAVERLSLLPAGEAVPCLVERLGDPSWRVRKAAIERLVAQPESAPAVRALVAALGDGENPGRRNAALEALTRFAADAVPVLVEASHDADVDVRKQAVDALAAIGEPAAAERLAELLADADANVRAAAAEALGELGARAAAPRLLACVDADAEPLVRFAALRSLAQLAAPVPVARLGAALADRLLRPAAYAVLGASDEAAACAVLLKGLSAPARSAREAAMEALLRQIAQAAPADAERLAARVRESGAEGVFLPDALVRLAEAKLTTRLVLVQFLGLLGRADCVVPLLEAGRDEALAELALAALASTAPVAEAAIESAWTRLSDDARVRACALLGRTRGAEGEALLRRALVAPDALLRGAAARALAERGATAALPALVAALLAAGAAPADALGDEADEAELLEAALRTLLEGAEPALGDRASALLEASLDGAPEGFRLASARLFGCLGGAHHVDRIELLLSDPSPAVRRAAVEALGRAPGGHLEALRCALADESPLVRIGAAAALAASGDPGAIADLAALAEDRDARVAAAALRALGSWAAAAGGTDARERALLLLSVGLAHGGTKALAALDALAVLGGPDAVALARGALASPDPELAEAAVACIGRHGGRDDLAGLLACLSHAHWSVRARVVRVLGERHHVPAMPAILRLLEDERDEFVRDSVLAALHRLESH